MYFLVQFYLYMLYIEEETQDDLTPRSRVEPSYAPKAEPYAMH